MVSPNKNAGFLHFFSCNFLAGVVISSRTIPLFCWPDKGAARAGAYFLAANAPPPSEAPSCSPQFFQNLCNDTEINPERGHKYQWQMQRR
jgi:hypothetical protein